LREPERELEPLRRLLLRLRQHLPLRLPRHLLLRRPLRRFPQPHDDDDARDDAVHSTSSSTRLLPRDLQPPSHRWPPALRGWQPPEPGPQPARISDSPLQREPLLRRRGSPR
jgi:hypothetical protein